MLGTTLTITTVGSGAGAKTLSRIRDDGYGAEYYLRETSGDFRVVIRHTSAKGRDRHFIELVQTVFATPTSVEIVAKCSVVIDAPPSYASTKNTVVLPLLDFLYGATTRDSQTADLNAMKIIAWDS